MQRRYQRVGWNVIGRFYEEMGEKKYEHAKYNEINAQPEKILDRVVGMKRNIVLFIQD